MKNQNTSFWQLYNRISAVSIPRDKLDYSKQADNPQKIKTQS